MDTDRVSPFDALRLLRISDPFDGFDELTTGALRLLRIPSAGMANSLFWACGLAEVIGEWLHHFL